MADVANFHAFALVELFLERQNNEHFFDGLPDGADSPAAPRPNLWADVIDHGNAEHFEPAREPEVEAGKIDEHREIRSSGFGRGAQPPHRVRKHRQFSDDLDEPNHRDLFEANNPLHTCGFCAGTAEAERGHRRAFLDELFQELGGIQVTGSLTAADEEAERLHVYGSDLR